MTAAAYPAAPYDEPDHTEAAWNEIRWMTFSQKRRALESYHDAWSRWEHYEQKFGKAAPGTFREWLLETTVERIARGER